VTPRARGRRARNCPARFHRVGAIVAMMIGYDGFDWFTASPPPCVSAC
jgi:hypothetical protein